MTPEERAKALHREYFNAITDCEDVCRFTAHVTRVIRAAVADAERERDEERDRADRLGLRIRDIRAEEREACAKLVESMDEGGYSDGPGPVAFAAAIRARVHFSGSVNPDPPGNTDE